MMTPAKHALFAWAWPSKTVNDLLCAAAHPHDDKARQAWHRWSHGTNLDDISYREMRLLAAVAPRLERLDPGHAERNRVMGIERSLWSRTHIVLSEISPAFELLHQSGIETMVLKGAARVARNRSALKSRFLSDVDILVRPREFRRAFELLNASGWQGSAPGTMRYQRTKLDLIHGVNLIRGQLADLDLHRSAFHHPHESLEEDEQMWARSTRGTLTRSPVQIPSATDSLIVALAHGGLGERETDDWLLDIIDTIAGGDVDWNLLTNLIERRRLEVPSAVVLTYLAEKLQCPIPEATLSWVSERAGKSRLDLLAGLLLSRPKMELSLPLRLAKLLARTWWLRDRATSCWPRETGAISRARRLWMRPKTNPLPLTYRATIPLSDREPDGRWHGTVEATITLPVPSSPRRIEFELTTGERHVARIKHRRRTSQSGEITLQFRAVATLEAGENELLLEAAPSGGLRPTASRGETERYAPLPFCVDNIRALRRA